MAQRTIGRNAAKKIADIKARVTGCEVRSLRYNFERRECPPEAAWGDLERFAFARLRLDDAGRTAIVDVHGNLWYELALAEEAS